MASTIPGNFDLFRFVAIRNPNTITRAVGDVPDVANGPERYEGPADFRRGAAAAKPLEAVEKAVAQFTATEHYLPNLADGILVTLLVAFATDLRAKCSGREGESLLSFGGRV